jgi:hypothetical protein
MELAKRIDFEMFRPILIEALRKAERKSPGSSRNFVVGKEGL